MKSNLEDIFIALSEAPGTNAEAVAAEPASLEEPVEESEVEEV